MLDLNQLGQGKKTFQVIQVLHKPSKEMRFIKDLRFNEKIHKLWEKCTDAEKKKGQELLQKRLNSLNGK